MSLGNFSVSLNVKDIHASKAFYEALGFEAFGGDINQNWLIMKQDATLIGLFQGMFDTNILTFNPGWDANANTLESFDDIRSIQQQLKEKGVELESETDANATGPGHISLKDPDGNVILIDQHV